MNTPATAPASQSKATPEIVTLPCHITSLSQVSVNTYQLELHAPQGTTLNYIAGHYAQISLDVSQDGKTHSLFYSIANDCDPKAPNRLQIFVQNTSDFVAAVLKRYAEKLDNNESINVTLPMGGAYLQSDLNAPHLLIAAGSGIAKIKALTEAIVRQNPNAALSIYWSNRKADEFYLLEDFAALANQHKDLTFTPILEKPDQEWSGRSGYIYEVVQNDFDSFEGFQAYLCGSPQMVYGTIDQLAPKGLREEDCRSDVFEYAPRNHK